MRVGDTTNGSHSVATGRLVMRTVKRALDMGHALRTAAKLARHDSWSSDQLADHQQKLFVRLFRHAVAKSPFYRDLYGNLQIVEDIRLTDLPVVDKRAIMNNFDQVVTDPRLRHADITDHLRSLSGDDYYLDEYRVLATSGTSGLRGIFVYNRDEWRVVMANTLRWNRYIGLEPRFPIRLRIATIGADSPIHVSRRIPASGNVGLFKMLHLEATREIGDMVAVLNRYRPDVLLPYPSVAGLLAHQQIEGRLNIRPRIISTHSEVLTSDTAARIQNAWGVRPYNHYGLTEEPHIGTDCGLHCGVHAFEDLCIIEVVDQSNQPVPIGTVGRKYLLTNLYNYTQPLIRYEVSDMISKSVHPCRCGRPFPLIAAIEGRSEDIFFVRSREGPEIAISPMLLTLCIESCEHVHEYQVRHDENSIHLKIVSDRDVDTRMLKVELTNRLRDTLEKQLAVPPPVEIEFVDKLSREQERMGKVKIVGVDQSGPI